MLVLVLVLDVTTLDCIGGAVWRIGKACRSN